MAAPISIGASTSSGAATGPVQFGNISLPILLSGGSSSTPQTTNLATAPGSTATTAAGLNVPAWLWYLAAGVLLLAGWLHWKNRA